MAFVRSDAARFAAILLACGAAVVLGTFSPLLSSELNTAPDGQFSQFFEGIQIWSDLYAGGWPSYADPTNMALYLVKYLFPATREGLDWFLLWALVMFSTGCGALAWTLTRSFAAALLGVTAGPVLGFLVAHLNHLSMIHASAYVPWMVLGAWLLAQRAGAGAVALLGCATGLSLLAGHPQITTYGLVGAGLFTFPVDKDLRRSILFLLQLGGAVVLGAGLAAVFLIPADALSGETLRAALTPASLAEFSLRVHEIPLNIWPYQAGGFWSNGAEVPYVFGGPSASWVENLGYVGAALSCLAIAAVTLSHDGPHVRRCVFVVVVSAILAIAPTVPGIAEVLTELPVLSRFRAWGRWQLVSSLFILQLACIGVAAVLDSQDRRRLAIAGAIAFVVVFCAFVAARGLDSGLLGARAYLTAQWAAAVASCALIAIKPKGTRRTFYIGIAVALVLTPVAELWHLSRGAAWLNAPGRPLSSVGTAQLSELKAALQHHPSRVLTLSGWQSPHRNPDAVRAAGLPSLNWYGPLLNERFAQLSGVTTGGWTRPDILDSNNQVLDIYSVGVVETYSEAVDPAGRGNASASLAGPRWVQISRSAPALFANRRALPRVRLLGKAVYLPDEAALAALTRSQLPGGGRFDAREQVIVPEASLAGTADLPPPAIATKITDGTIEVSVASPVTTRTFLVVGDNYSSNWRARVDGRVTDVVRVNFNQIGVALPPGAHHVELYYRDDRLFLGAFISACSLLIIVVLLGRRRGAALNG